MYLYLSCKRILTFYLLLHLQQFLVICTPTGTDQYQSGTWLCSLSISLQYHFLVLALFVSGYVDKHKFLIIVYGKDSSVKEKVLCGVLQNHAVLQSAAFHILVQIFPCKEIGYHLKFPHALRKCFLVFLPVTLKIHIYQICKNPSSETNLF